jgi:hypothetical protein
VQPLAVKLLPGELHDGDTIEVAIEDGRLAFRRLAAPVAATA